ncbi:hypothetical protein CBS101457_003879 [Exobasidium rhododendri]|nr:hypothetical protein CBS101457_003879 [Exobasidium rhododendri]
MIATSWEQQVVMAVRSGGSGDGEEEEGEGSSSRHGSIKREEGVEIDESLEQGSAAMSRLVPINSTMVWHRLGQLYDISGLEELENQAADNDPTSPFQNPHPLQRSKSRQSQSFSSPFGYGSGLELQKKLPKGGRGGNSKKAVTALTEDEIANIHGVGIKEFELGPWEEYENLIAPRRLKIHAPEEDEHSDSDEELSEPSEAEDEVGIDATNAERKVEGEEDGEEEEEEEGEEEENREEERDDDDDDDDDDDEEEEEGDEEEKETSSKRKATSRRGQNPAKKSKKESAASRGTRNSSKPRRSTRK